MDSILERQAIRVAVALAAVSGHGKTAQIIADMRDESTHLISLCLQGSTTPHQICAWCDDISDRIGRAVARGDFDDQSVLDTVMMILRLRLIATRLARQIDDRVTKKPSNSGDVQIRELQQSVASLTENAQKVFEHIKNNPDVRTKELIDSFAKTFSARSTKRYLAELLGAKVIRRKELEDGGVVYTVRT